MIAWIPLLLQGTLTTIKLWLCASALSIVLGTLTGIVRCTVLRKAPLALPLDYLGLVVRGVPLYAQLMIFYFALPELTRINLTPFSAGVIALGLCSTAHTSEIIRGAINTLSSGQWKAAYTLGYTRIEQLRFIILPQVFRAALPTLVNEYVMVMKSTSILASIGTLELTKMSLNIMYRSFNPLGMCLSTACIYLLLTSIVSGVGRLLERKYDVSRAKPLL